MGDISDGKLPPDIHQHCAALWEFGYSFNGCFSLKDAYYPDTTPLYLSTTLILLIFIWFAQDPHKLTFYATIGTNCALQKKIGTK